MTPHQKKFAKASEAARKKCHRTTTTPGTYGTCFGKSMKDALKGKGKGKAKGKKATSRCAGIRKSGPRKGTLKKGYKYAKNKKCPVKV